MARILVTSEGQGTVLMDEDVLPVHLDDYGAEQFIERLAWAIQDAETEKEQEAVTDLLQTAAS